MRRYGSALPIVPLILTAFQNLPASGRPGEEIESAVGPETEALADASEIQPYGKLRLP
jgi:hypothetical protein